MALNRQQEARIVKAILDEVHRKPPTIAVIGLSGSGKSSVINRLFRTTLPVSHTSACTKDFLYSDIGLEIRNGVAAGQPVSLRVIDCPGLGEDVTLESGYLEHYQKHLPEADVILYVTAARNRGAVALEQMHLRHLLQYVDRMVFGLSQADLVEPRDWNVRLNRPGELQMKYIEEICEDRAARFATVAGRQVRCLPFASSQGFGLQSLFTALILNCPPERAWIFESLKAFDFRQFIPAAALLQLGDCP